MNALTDIRRALGARALLCGAVLFLLPGCMGPAQRLEVAGPDWTIREGQALWHPHPHRPEFSGDLIVATRTDGAYVFNFTKTPIPVAMGHVSATNWLFEVPAKPFRMHGKGKPPSYFAWLYLDAALRNEPLPSALKFKRKPDGGWRLENINTGEIIDGYLNP